MELHDSGSHSSVQCDTLCVELCRKTGVALCTLLPISVLSGEFQARAQPCQLSFKHCPPSKAITQAVLCHPLCLPSCAGIHVVRTKAWSISFKVNVEGSVAVRRVLEGQLKPRCTCTKAQPHPYPVWLPSLYLRCSPKHSSVNCLHPSMYSEHTGGNPCLDMEISNIWGHLEVSSEANLKSFT